jgi:hypothetical protein
VCVLVQDHSNNGANSSEQQLCKPYYIIAASSFTGLRFRMARLPAGPARFRNRLRDGPGKLRQRTGEPTAPQSVNAKRGRELTKVGLGGVEPPTSRLSGVRSNHLSYRPQTEATT